MDAPRSVFAHEACEDLVIAEQAEVQAGEAALQDRLVFDGYRLYWNGSGPSDYTAFSGPADESARESTKEVGPTPQGKYAINPARIQLLTPSDDWGSFRVPLEPYGDTVQRMKDCFKLVRTGMYIHGGSVTGTHGCIEINDDAEESDFFSRLADRDTPIELEVSYVGDRKNKYEETKCPY